MPNFFDMFKQKNDYRKIIPIIFAIDASGSMNGNRIFCLNHAIRTVIKKYVDYNSSLESKFNIKIALLKFSSGSQWLTEGLMDPAELSFSGINCGGMTDLGSALNEINNKLSRNEFFTETTPYAAPFICFITDGMPTDNYVVSLKKLNTNKWYESAKKVAIAIGDMVDFNVLNEVVGTSESVVHLNNETLLEQVMVGLCTTLFTSAVSVATCFPPSVAQTTKSAQPVRPITKTEFDSDHVCCSMMASQPNEFDSDSFGETCVLEAPKEFDDTWDDSDWDDWDTPSQTVSSDIAKRRKELAKALESIEAIDDDDKAAVEAARSESDAIAKALSGNRIEKPGTEVREFAEFQISESANGYTNNSWFGIQVPDGKLAGGGNICSFCGNALMTGHKFCSGCGAPIKQIVSSKVNVSQVQFSAIVPKRFTKGEYAMIDISVYEELYRNIVDRIIANADDEVKEVIASSQEIVDNTLIRIKLSSPDLELIDCDETQKWQGKYLTFSFPVEIPSNYAKKQILFIANVYFNDVIATKLKFIANCSSAREQKIQLTREDVLTAFISYASQDRSRVATIIQGMQKARPDMDIFFDVESLRSGDDWESALRREIEKRDILFLCWSNYARNSEWVDKEWRYALANKGIDAIEPVPLVSPIDCPPPDELKSKHFNDRALLYQEIK